MTSVKGDGQQQEQDLSGSDVSTSALPVQLLCKGDRWYLQCFLRELPEL